MATRVSTYDPSKIRVTVGGFIIKGFAPGSMVEYRADQPAIVDDEGVDGEAVRWHRNNPYSTLTLYLSQASESNFTLSTLLNLDRLSLAAVVPVIIEDRSGGAGQNLLNIGSGAKTRLIAGSGWLREWPEIRWGRDHNPRRWIVRLLNVIHDIRGYNENQIGSA